MSKLSHPVMQRKPRKPRRLARTNQVKKIGAEIEGFWDYNDLNNKTFPTIDYDGSLHFDEHEGGECDGACRDNCECYYDCECDSCSLCDGCRNCIDECDCENCLICDECSEDWESCTCFYKHYSDCNDKKCNDNNMCDNCDELSRERQQEHLFHNCQEAGNLTWECDQECNCECECECDCEGSCDGKIGEIASPAFLKVDECSEYIDKFYPSETNTTCGLHIHVSVKNEQSYKRLMTQSFNAYFLKQVEKFAMENKIGFKNGIINDELKSKSAFWRRLAGKNSYCQKVFNPRIQFRNVGKDSSRYNQLNFCYNLIGANRKKNHTLECRLFPAFQKKEISINAIKFFYELIQSFLNREYVEKYKDILKSKAINEVIVLGEGV